MDFVFSYLSDHGKPLSPNSMRAIFKKTLTKAKVDKKISVQLLRKQAVNKLSLHGIPQDEIQALRGWSERSSMSFYNLRSSAQQGQHSSLLWTTQ